MHVHGIVHAAACPAHGDLWHDRMTPAPTLMWGPHRANRIAVTIDGDHLRAHARTDRETTNARAPRRM